MLGRSATARAVSVGAPVQQRQASSMWPRMALLAVAGAMMLADLYLIFLWAPTDSNLGDVQRILYIHVPMAWVAFLAFFMVLVGSVLYLWRRDSRWDALAHASAEIGVIFASLVLVTGIIWAKPLWGCGGPGSPSSPPRWCSGSSM